MPKIRTTKPGSFVDLGTFEGASIKPRKVRLYLPPAPPPGVLRPALVLFDGQNVFGDEGSFSGGWHVHQAIDKLVAGKPIAPIVIGIDHGDADRIDELGPWREGNKGGRADAMIEMLVERVLPEAKKSAPISDFVIVGGSSMGGLCSIYAHLTRPDVFKGALAMSPSIWFGRRKIFDLARTSSLEGSSFYVDAGAREMRGVLLAACHMFADELRRNGCKRIMFRADAKGTHTEGAWRRRLPKALRFFYS